MKDSFGYNIYEAEITQIKNSDLELPVFVNIGLCRDHFRIFTRKYKKIVDIDYERFWKWGFSDSEFSILFGKTEKHDEEEEERP